MKSKLFLSVLLLTFLLAGKFVYSQDSDIGPVQISVSVDPDVIKKSSSQDPVTGENIEDGKGIEFKYLGKVYTFANEKNLETFKSEPINYIKNLTCPVMAGDPADKEQNFAYEGVKYYTCCEFCLAKLQKNPAKYMNGAVNKEKEKREHDNK